MSTQIKGDENKIPNTGKDGGGSGTVVPQSYKGMTLEEARVFLRSTMELFHSLAPMTDLKSLYEAGKQLSRLYFDCASHQRDLAEMLLELDFPEYAIKTMKKLNNMGVFKNDDIWFSSFYLYNICWNYSDASFEFATALALCGLPNLLSLNIGHKPYLDNLSSRNVYYLIKASLSIIHNICRYPGSCLHFRSESVRASLRNLIDREEDFIRVVASLCLASVSSESTSPGEPTDYSGGNNDVLRSIIGYVRKARASERGRFMGFRSHELLQGLRAATATEIGRRRFLDSNDLDGVTLLREIMQGGNCGEEELAECLEIACNLTVGAVGGGMVQPLTGFDANSVRAILSTGAATNSSRVTAAAEDLLWALGDESDDLQLNEGDDAVTDSSTLSVMMIHAPVNRFSVLKIRDRLQQQQQLAVRILEAPATTRQARQNVRRAQIIVLCVSEALKTIPRCQLQVQLALQLRKPMLALLVQQKYRADGWLQTALMQTTLIDLSSKRDFEATWDSFTASLGERIRDVRSAIVAAAAASMARQQQHMVTAAVATTAAVKLEKGAAVHSTATVLTNCAGVGSAEDELAGSHMVDPISTRSGTGPLEYSRYNGGDQQDAVIAAGEGPLNNASINIASGNAGATDMAMWLEKHKLSHLAPTLHSFDLDLLTTYRDVKQTVPSFFYESLERQLKLDIADALRFAKALDSL